VETGLPVRSLRLGVVAPESARLAPLWRGVRDAGADVIILPALADASEMDAVLIDLAGGAASDLAGLRALHAARPALPILVIASEGTEPLALEALEAGARDYLLRDAVRPDELVRSLETWVARSRTEEALERERMFLQNLLENIPDRIYFKDLESRFLRISRATAVAFGLGDPAEALGRTDRDFFLPQHADVALEDERAVLRTGTAVVAKVEEEIFPDGRHYWMLTTKVPLRDAGGRVVGTFGISRDVTRLKQMEEALDRERNLLRRVIDNIPDPIYVKDLDGRYVVDNRAHQVRLGVAGPEEVVGRTVGDFFPPELAGKYLADDRRVLQTGEPIVNLEERVGISGGDPRWHLTTKIPLRGPDGDLAGIVCISRDIHAQKNAEDELRRTNAELERRREELESVLSDLRASHEALKAAQMHLIQAEKLESVGRLAAGIAHEVKNPLATIRLGIDFLSSREATMDADSRVVLGEMAHAVGRADGVIRELLDFSAARDLRLVDADLDGVVDGAMALVRLECERSRVAVWRQPSEPLPRVRMDRNKAEQVLVNLLLNAAHAMPEGGEVRVRTGLSAAGLPGAVRPDRGDRSGAAVRAAVPCAFVEVRDRGPGIDPAVQAKVFDPFFTTKPTGKGTGLGLTVVKKIMEMHGGWITLENHPEGGLVATVAFPLAGRGDVGVSEEELPWPKNVS
jgi:PAS domain S-box-containing protein